MILFRNIDAFQSPEFRRYFFGTAFSLQALWIQRTTIAWLAWDLSGSATFVGWVAFLIFAPVLVTGPVFGVLVDRAPVRQAAILSQSAMATISTLMAIAHGFGVLSAGLLMGMALGVGLIASAHHPIRMSLAPLLVPRSAVGSIANASAINFNLARSTGPAIGGLLISEFGIGAALWAVALFGLPQLYVLRGLHPRDRTQSAPAGDGIWNGLRSGFGYAVASPVIRQILMTTLMFALVGRGVLELLPLIADGLHGRGAAGHGQLASAAGLGALVAAGLAAMMRPVRPGEVPLAGRIAAGGGIFLAMTLVVIPTWPMVLATTATLGGFGTAVGIAMQSALLPYLPDDLRGRVMSLWVMTGIGGAALGALLLGLIADGIGLVPGTISVGGAALVALVLLPRLLR